LKNHDKMLGFRRMLMYLSIIIVLHCFIKKKQKKKTFMIINQSIWISSYYDIIER